MKSYIKIAVFILLSACTHSIPCMGQYVSGTVYGKDASGNIQALEGANIYWQGSNIGEISDSAGNFTIKKTDEHNKLITHFVGYLSDTLTLSENDSTVRITLSGINTLQGVTVNSDETSYISIQPIFTQVITSDGLRKAACCNLAESFESNTSVDVSYSDAVSGAKQIQMLGLDGKYTQIMLGNTPYIRGVATPLGLLYVPGTWMESISISKGTASVVNGYESITGQISIIYKKPETNKEKVFINAFLNTQLRNELNFNTRIPVKENVSTMILGHVENTPLRMDHNQDGFMDAPLNTHVNLMNRWDYAIPNKLSGHLLYSYLYDNRLSGENNVRRTDKGSTDRYCIGIQNHRFNLIDKNGIFLKGENESIGSIVSFTFHDYDAYYGLKAYQARQLSGYVNVFYENYLDKRNRHKIDAGLSCNVDYFFEWYQLLTIHIPEANYRFKHTEIVPGAFAQYCYILKDKLAVIAGFRLDYNNLHGLFWTPRMHVKWQFTPTGSLRFAAGKGYRTPHPLMENTGLMASGKTLVITENPQAEEAYNAGVNFTQLFNIKNQQCSFMIDYYFTYFVHQNIADIDQDYYTVYFRNTHNKAYSHAVQAELQLHPVKRMEITAAYRYTLTKENINNTARTKALLPPHKALLSMSYATKFERWKFALTLQFHSQSSLPDAYVTFFNSHPELLPEELKKMKTPAYFGLSAQITRKFKYIEIYVGGENLTNYRQKTPILDAADPFGTTFDASMVWGPIMGIMGYVGIRFTMKYNNI